MSWASYIKHLYRRLRHPDRSEAELDEEVQSYFDVIVERRISRGLSREEAERAARLEFDGPGRVKEKVREARAGAGIETTWRDFRYALRTLRKNPGFAVAAVLSLGLALGANTAIFTLVNTVMLKSLPVKDADSLFFIDTSGGKDHGNAPPYPCFERLRDNSRYFSGMAAFSGERFKVTIDGAPEQINGQYASGSYFDVLGVGARIGRVMTPEDDSRFGAGGPQGAVAVISDALWKKRFRGDPAVIGKSVRVGETAATIVGVTPPGFSGIEPGFPSDITVPIALNPGVRSKRMWWMGAVGRLKDGASPEQARAELDASFQTYMGEIGMKGSQHFNRIALIPAAKGSDGLRQRFAKPLLIVMTIVGLVLLIGCANVANLLLARAGARRGEIALRLAIGASRWTLIRQLFTEGLVLSGIAAGVGILFARWGVAALATLLSGVQGRIVLEPAFDGAVAAFLFVAALATTLLFSIAPALYTTRADAARPAGNVPAGLGGFRFGAGQALVVIQIMLSTVLLCGAALFLRSLHNLTHLDAGFERESVLTMQVDAAFPQSGHKLSAAAEEEYGRVGRMWEDLLEPVRELPKVKAVSASSMAPLNGHYRGLGMKISGEPSGAGRDHGTRLNEVSSGFFDAFGVGLLSGRIFTPGDRAGSPRVAILNETLTRAAFHDSSPLGRRVTFPGQDVTAEYEIVGIVRDVRYASLRKEAEPMVYLPIEQGIGPLPSVIVTVRARDEAGVLLALRRRTREIVPGGFITNVATVRQLIDDSLLLERLLSILASLFGGLALLLAAVGLYGIVSFSVIRRTREIGVRIAMGAQRGTVLWMILRNTAGLAAVGLALGIPLVFLAKKYIDSELFGLHADDPLTIAGATLVLTCVVLAAGIWPACRASRLDPMISLRQE
jgi:predicted permease